jgi:hypothetical protein
MAYESLSKYQKTTNFSQRDIDQKFNLVEFNRIFEQNNLVLENKNNNEVTPKCPVKSEINIFFIIVCIIIIIGFLLLLFNNYFIYI